MHLLLIEDDPSVAAFVAKSLREEGHLVDHCADGPSGLAQASAERYDAIVLDRMLPGLDGIAVLEAIRGTGDTTPVLILSALGDTADGSAACARAATTTSPSPSRSPSCWLASRRSAAASSRARPRRGSGLAH